MYKLVLDAKRQEAKWDDDRFVINARWLKPSRSRRECGVVNLCVWEEESTLLLTLVESMSLSMCSCKHQSVAW